MTIDTAGRGVTNIHSVGVGAMDERPEEWLERLFEYEFCTECGGDAENQEVCIIPGIGTYFARCIVPVQTGTDDDPRNTGD